MQKNASSHLVVYRPVNSIAKIFTVLILQAGLAPIVAAQEVMQNNSLGSYSWEAIKVVVSLTIVLGIFYLLVNVFKKYTGVSIKANSTIRVIGGLSLGGKDKVVILEAGDVNLLLGVSASGITKLHQFSQDEMATTDDQDIQPSSFGQQIEKILGKKDL